MEDTFCVDLSLFPFRRGSTNNNGSDSVTLGGVAVNTSPAQVHALPTVWAFLFGIFHVLYLLQLISHIPHVKWESTDSSDVPKMIEFTVIVYILIPFSSLFFILYSYLVSVLVKLGKYKILVKVIGVVLHQILVLDGESDEAHQTIFALHMASIVCYIRNEARGDPSGFISVMVLAFARSAASNYKANNRLFGIYVIVAICAVLALVTSFPYLDLFI